VDGSAVDGDGLILHRGHSSERHVAVVDGVGIGVGISEWVVVLRSVGTAALASWRQRCDRGVDLPFLDESLRKFTQKTGRWLEGLAGSRHESEQGAAEVEFVLGSCQRDVEEPTLFLLAVGGLCRAPARKQTVAEHDDEHGPELEALGLVDCRELESILVVSLSLLVLFSFDVGLQS
jgi:hypothetical protein